VLGNSLLDDGFHWRSLVLHRGIAVLGGDIPSFGVVLKSVNREPDLGGPSCSLCFAFDLGCERRKVVGTSTLGYVDWFCSDR
jgi:hypothetical protein